jgi:hypothetical protein
MVSEPLFDYYDIHLSGYTVVFEEPEPDDSNDPVEELELL